MIPLHGLLCHRSQVDIQHFRAKQQAVEREESKRVTSGRQPSLRVKSSRRLSKKQSSASSPKQSSPSYAVAEEVVLREVWVQQAHLLLQQVRTCIVMQAPVITLGHFWIYTSNAQAFYIVSIVPTSRIQ